MINATWPWKLGAHMYVHKELFHHDKYFVKLWWSLRSTSWWLPGWSVLTAGLPPTFISSGSPTPGWLPSDGATPKPAHSKLECRKRGRNRKSTLWCIFLKKKYVFPFLQLFICSPSDSFQRIWNSWRKGNFCELCATDSGEKERICLYLVTRASALVGTRNKNT